MLVDAVNGASRRHHVHAQRPRLSARKLWIGFASQVDGSVTVDDGAYRALVERGTSLLPAGVIGVDGDVRRGCDRRGAHLDGVVVARGMVRDVSRRGAGITPVAARATFPSNVAHEVIHRDDLVLLPH